MAVGGCAYFTLLQAAVRSHARAVGDRTGRPGRNETSFSVLRPLCGRQPGLESTLRDGFSLGSQRHELLFAAAESADPGLDLARSMARRAAGVRWLALVAGPPRCPNAKVHSLAAMTEAATGDVLVIMDSDVRPGAGLLDALAREFSDPDVGVLTCPYRAVAGGGPWSWLEALGMNTEFWGGVLVAQFLMPMDFAVGPTMAVRRSCLDDLGGWAQVEDYLAEDFRLGRLARTAGWKVRLASHVVEHCIGSSAMLENLAHRMRWRRSTKRSRPAAYWGEIFTNPLPWALALAACLPHQPWAWVLLGACGVLRFAAARAVCGTVLGGRLGPLHFALLPLQDLLSALSWAAGLFGRTVQWGPRSFELLRDGRLRPSGR